AHKAYERLLAIDGNGPWSHEARYEIAWSYQKQKQPGKALEFFSQIPPDPPTMLSARARVQAGICRLEQRQYAEAAAAFGDLPARFAYSELTAFALLEGAHAHARLKHDDQARKLLERLIKNDYPGTKWAEIAAETLKSEKEATA